jgi:predicted metal-dependent phosphoesterase TrpH
MEHERRGVIHLHSRYSYDSLLSPSRILITAQEAGWDFVILTDHNTIRGSQALRELARKKAPHIDIPIAAEYRTECGDMIAAFIEEEIVEMRLAGFVANVKAQGGLLLLPHPYVSHDDPERLAVAADLIEVANSRATPEQNHKALALAKRLGKPTYVASDAHLRCELGNAVVKARGGGRLQNILQVLGTEVTYFSCAAPSVTYRSQMIKAGKTGSVGLLAYNLYAYARWSVSGDR